MRQPSTRRGAFVVASILACGLLIAPALLHAQTRRVGFGMAVNTGEPTPPVFRMPINLTSRLRVEPEIGFEREKYNVTYTDVPLGDGPSAVGPERYENRRTTTSFGTSVFLLHSRDRVQVQYGGRFGRVLENGRDAYSGYGEENTSESRSRGYFAGPAIGGEYFFTDRFSLGIDLMLRYTSSKSSGGESDRMTARRKQWHTEAALTARVYAW